MYSKNVITKIGPCSRKCIGHRLCFRRPKCTTDWVNDGDYAAQYSVRWHQMPMKNELNGYRNVQHNAAHCNLHIGPGTKVKPVFLLFWIVFKMFDICFRRPKSTTDWVNDGDYAAQYSVHWHQMPRKTELNGSRNVQHYAAHCNLRCHETELNGSRNVQHYAAQCNLLCHDYIKKVPLSHL